MKFADGWLSIPFDGSDWASVKISTGGDWLPAFFGFDGGRRVVKVRPDRTGSARISLSVDGSESDCGRITL